MFPILTIRMQIITSLTITTSKLINLNPPITNINGKNPLSSIALLLTPSILFKKFLL